MSRHSTDPSFWHRYAEEYEQRLSDLAGAVAAYHVVKADDIIRGDFSGIEHICRTHDLHFQLDRVAEFVSPRFWNSPAE